RTFGERVRMDEFKLNSKLELFIQLLAGTVFSATASLLLNHEIWHTLGVLLSFALSLFVLTLAFGVVAQAVVLGDLQDPFALGVVNANLATAITFVGWRIVSNMPLSNWALVSLFFVMPYIYAFGTSVNYWRAGAAAGVFWLLASIIFLAPLVRGEGSWRFALPSAIAAQAVTLMVMLNAVTSPYRQPGPLLLNDVHQSIGKHGSTLVLTPGYAQYVANAMAITREAGFRDGYPMLDLTGQSPGLLYSLGAKSVGQAWMIGGYPGSLARALTTLKDTTCIE